MMAGPLGKIWGKVTGAFWFSDINWMLEKAADRGDLATVSTALDGGANPRRRKFVDSRNGGAKRSLLVHVCGNPKSGAEVARKLAAYWSPTERMEGGWTPLHEAASKGRADVVKALLDLRWSVGRLSQGGESALEAWLEGGKELREPGESFDRAGELLAEGWEGTGSWASEKRSNGLWPAQEAARFGAGRAAAALWRLASPEARERMEAGGAGPLAFACGARSAGAIKALIEAGADARARIDWDAWSKLRHKANSSAESEKGVQQGTYRKESKEVFGDKETLFASWAHLAARGGKGWGPGFLEELAPWATMEEARAATRQWSEEELPKVALQAVMAESERIRSSLPPSPADEDAPWSEGAESGSLGRAKRL